MTIQPNNSKIGNWLDQMLDSSLSRRLKQHLDVILDAGLITTALLMIVTDAVVFYFHLIFLLLTVGAFYWQIRAFAVRSVIWTSVTVITLLVEIYAGTVHPDEITEIPLLTGMIILVFIIAQRRAAAEEELRHTNEDLELRVLERTAKLTQVNAELTHEIDQRKKTEATLRESEDRYRRLVELSFEAIVIHHEGKLVVINPFGIKLLGASNQDEVIGKSIFDFVHPDYVDLVRRRSILMLEREEGVPLTEEKFVRLDGSPIDVEVAGVPITYDGKPAIQAVIRDITARKKAETEREHLLATEREHRILAETLGDVFLALSAQTSYESVLDEILLQARRIVSFSAANIMLLDKNNTLHNARHRGYHTYGNQQFFSHLTQSLDSLPLDAQVIRSRQPLLIPNVKQNPLWVTVPELKWIKSFIAMPICLGARVLGILRLDGDTEAMFSPQDVEQLKPLAHAAAIALENARLYEQVRQELKEREQAEQALREIAAKNQAILDAITDSIFHLNREGRLLDYKIPDHRHSKKVAKLKDGSTTVTEIFPSDLAQLTLQHISTALNTGTLQIFEYALETTSDTRNLEFRIGAAGQDEVMVVLCDITEFKQHQAALENERSRIARDLHDSLGQNLGYLRLKLDEFTLDGVSYDYGKIREELVRMREVTNDSYELVRSMLAAARPANSSAFAEVLLAQAKLVGTRAQFKVDLTSAGQPRSLPPVVQQQLLYICKEALINIEKHAQAQRVKINLLWNSDSLTIKLTDDGRGFKTDVPIEAGHFGLTIMQERAAEIGGHLSVASKPGAGTELTLLLLD